MNKERICKIVQDLLPNYIDGLTNAETNLFIEKHIKECDYCKKIFENMKQDLKVDKTIKNLEETNYIKKYSKKLKLLKILLFISLIVALIVMTNYYFVMKRAYFRAPDILVNMVKEGMYPDTFYAIIEEISDSEVHGVKELTVKGLNTNDKNHRDTYYFSIILDNIGDNFKIKWNNTNISIEDLKVGQTVAVNYGDTIESDPYNLSRVRMLVVLDDKL